MQTGQRHRCLDDLCGEKPLDRAGNARELRVPFGVIFVAVQLFQEEAGRIGMRAAAQQIRIGPSEAQRLQTLDLDHSLPK